MLPIRVIQSYRAQLIAESIRDAEFALDIHSCSADVAGPFALPSLMGLSEELAELLPARFAVKSLVHACWMVKQYDPGLRITA